MLESLRSKIVVTRKPHNCFGCGRKFKAGTKMLKEEMLDNGLWSCYLCETCQKIVSDMSDDDSFCYSDLMEEALALEGNEE